MGEQLNPWAFSLLRYWLKSVFVPASVSADAPLMEAGLDSLGAVEFRNRLASKLNDAVELNDTLLFDFPTMRQIATHLGAM